MRNAAVSMSFSEGNAEMPQVSVSLQTVRAPARERMTSPAPATFERHTAIPSSRPTSVPDIDVAALATALSCSLRDTSAASFAADNAVPVRERAPTNVQALTFEATFLLAHVDGCSTIGQIAWHAQIPVARAITAFGEMFELGVVSLASEPTSPPPSSGVYRAFRVEE